MAKALTGNNTTSKKNGIVKQSLGAKLKRSYVEWRDYKNKELKRLKSEESIWRIILKFFLPIWLSIFFAFACYFIFPNDIFNLIILFGVYFISPLGMEIGVPIGIGLGLNPFLVVGFMLLVDALSAMFLIWNLDYTRLIPFIGKLIKKTEEKGSNYLKKQQWIERLAFLGLVGFVMIPLYGTGSILGSIVGRIMGMDSWKNWFAVIIGSAIRLGVSALIVVGVIEFFF
jgi:uncharacterized membrane protein